MSTTPNTFAYTLERENARTALAEYRRAKRKLVDAVDEAEMSRDVPAFEAAMAKLDALPWPSACVTVSVPGESSGSGWRAGFESDTRVSFATHGLDAGQWILTDAAGKHLGGVSYDTEAQAVDAAKAIRAAVRTRKAAEDRYEAARAANPWGVICGNR